MSLEIGAGGGQGFAVGSVLKCFGTVVCVDNHDALVEVGERCASGGGGEGGRSRAG
jgi:hypothetical protein